MLPPAPGFWVTLVLMASLRRASLSSEGENDHTLGRLGRKLGSPGVLPPKIHPGPTKPPGGLTAQCWHEILQGFAVEGEGGVCVSLLVLPHRLHHQLGLGDTKGGSQALEPPRSQGAAPSPAHRLAQALGAGYVLHVHEGVGKEGLEGDALVRVPLQQLPQEIPALQRELGAAGELGREGAEPSERWESPQPQPIPSQPQVPPQPGCCGSSPPARQRSAKQRAASQKVLLQRKGARGEVGIGKPAPSRAPRGNRSLTHRKG